MFQFQTGSIKSGTLKWGQCCLRLFQFQTGSIKSLSASEAAINLFGFNSKLVRLKVTSSIMGPLRICSCFNSKLVRLKVRRQLWVFLIRLSFNSKLVRLKEQLGSSHSTAKTLFQFQTGSIKRIDQLIQTNITAYVSIPNWFD